MTEHMTVALIISVIRALITILVIVLMECGFPFSLPSILTLSRGRALLIEFVIEHLIFAMQSIWLILVPGLLLLKFFVVNY